MTTERAASTPTAGRSATAGSTGSTGGRAAGPGAAAERVPGAAAERVPGAATHRPRAAGDRRALRQAATLLGLSASTYAVTLAAVTGLQAAADQAKLVALGPSQDAVAAVAARNDRLAADLLAAGAAYGTAADEYAALLARLDALERELRDLQTAANEVSGGATALPDRVALPRVASRANVGSPPKVHATTGASGG
jgi:prefoldin subunit 5